MTEAVPEHPAKRVKVSAVGAHAEADAKCLAKAAVTWHVVQGMSKDEIEQEIDAGGSQFTCEYYHQCFGEDEEILGYKDLSIDIWLSAKSYIAWCAMFLLCAGDAVVSLGAAASSP